MVLKTLVFALTLFSLESYAKVKVEDLVFNSGNLNKVTVKLSENLKQSPELEIKDNIIQLEIPGAYVWPKIEKKISWGENKFDTTLMAYQFNKEVVRFRIVLPQNIKNFASKINVREKSNNLEIYFPKRQVIVANKEIKKDVETKSNKVDDDKFLNQLISQSKENTAEVAEDPNEKANNYFEDKLQQKFSAEKKEKAPEFSFNKYLLKFVAFLGLILLGFYSVVFLFKKGVVKKGKLGFLNSTKLVEVLSTTHVAPKKSVMLIKAHKQVFLVASSENGMNLLSEINDVNGLIKEGEKNIAGNNFDSDLEAAEDEPKEFNLKEVLTQSEGVEEKFEKVQERIQERVEASEKEKVRLSDQIKNKVKGLKPLQ